MTLVAPHARRAVLIGKAIDRKAGQAAILASILDSLSAGLFLIEADGRIALANAVGREILDADDFLRSINGRLVTPAVDPTVALDTVQPRATPHRGGAGTSSGIAPRPTHRSIFPYCILVAVARRFLPGDGG